MADRLDLGDRHVALADLQRLLPRPVAAHLGRRRVDAQELVRELERAPVGKAISSTRDVWCSLISVGTGVVLSRPAMAVRGERSRKDASLARAPPPVGRRATRRAPDAPVTGGF